MHKFTVFSIILSLSVLLILGDVVIHDYLNPDNYPSNKDLATSEEDSSDFALDTEDSEPNVELSEESETENLDVVYMDVELREELFLQAGFIAPILKETLFSGLVFQFLPFSDQTDALIYQVNLFEGENYVGSVSEMTYPSETASLQGYLTLRDRAAELTELGEINEVNNHGSASFYFNHVNKTKTVHFVMRSGSKIYAFEYPYAQHENMKKVFDLL